MDFEAQEHAALAVSHRHGTTITTAAGVFQLSVQHASKAEWQAAVAAHQGSDGILRLKGLPARAGPPDVLAFFEVRRHGRAETSAWGAAWRGSSRAACAACTRTVWRLHSPPMRLRLRWAGR